MKELLTAVLKARASPQGWEWLEKGLAATRPPVHVNTLLGYFAGAGRRVGKLALALSEEEAGRAGSLDAELPLHNWGADEAARALMLLTLAERVSADDFVSLALECYRKGDSREQQSWLRALSLLPGCERFRDTAIDACRTNIIPLFESIACENPYPLRHFPELNFNQMVLKALFNGIAISRFVGLEQRLNDDLSRMADDYVNEREAAGRSVPTDIWLVLAPRIGSDRLPRVHRYLEHDDPDHRYWAAVGLGHAKNGATRAVLETRRGVERDERVRGALEASLVNRA